MRLATTATWLLASLALLLPAAAQGRARLEGLAGRLVQEHGLQGADRAAAFARTHGLKVRRVGGVDQVEVILEPRGARAAKGIDPARLSALGATVDAASASYVRVLVPFGRLEALASHPDVAVVRTPTPHKALGGVGPFVSEAVALTGAAELQAAGATGEGVKVAVVAASLMEPADASGAFSVGAVDQADWDDGAPIEDFSSQGPTTDGRDKPDLAAPDGTSSMTYGASGSYGTSFASPTTAGAAALLLSADPGATADGVAASLTSGAVDAGDEGYDLVYGAGLLALAAGPACALDEDCDDADACNGAETCEAGTCLAGTPVGCDDGNPCNGAETCDPGTGDCLAGTPLVCDDGDVCNGAETCDTSGCVAGVALDCGDWTACTDDSCDPGAGCMHVAVDCDDADPCTVDSCDDVAGCQYEPVACGDDGDACTTDACDSGTGECGVPRDCDMGQACRIYWCDSDNGCQDAPVGCADDDGCCPDACDGGNDSDCAPLCKAAGASCRRGSECCSNRCSKRRCR